MAIGYPRPTTSTKRETSRIDIDVICVAHICVTQLRLTGRVSRWAKRERSERDGPVGYNRVLAAGWRIELPYGITPVCHTLRLPMTIPVRHIDLVGPYMGQAFRADRTTRVGDLRAGR